MKPLYSISTEKMNLQPGDKISIYKVDKNNIPIFPVVERTNGQKDIFNMEGERLIDVSFNKVDIGSNIIVGTAEGGKYIFLNGKMQMMAGLNDEILDDNHVRTTDPKTGLHGMTLIKEKIKVFGELYEDVELLPNSKGYFVSQEGKYGILKESGEVRIPIQYPMEAFPTGDCEIFEKAFPIKLEDGRYLLYTANGETHLSEPAKKFMIFPWGVLLDGWFFEYQAFDESIGENYGVPKNDKPIKDVLAVYEDGLLVSYLPQNSDVNDNSEEDWEIITFK